MEQHLLTLGFKSFERPTAAEAKSRWKELCRKHHPDVGGDENEFKKVTHAYKMLTDSEYRHKEIIKEATKRPNMFGDLNIRFQLNISFEAAFFGKDARISYNIIKFDENNEPIEEEVHELESVKVKITAGIDSNSVIHMPGLGHKCGENRGDLYVNIAVSPHAKFRKMGADVISEEGIPLDVMIKGGKLEVLTMHGIKKVHIKPGTLPGDKVVIKKCGLLKRGNHVMQVQPIYPTEDELRGDKWRGLPIDWTPPPKEEGEVDEDEAHFDDVFERLTRMTGTTTFTMGG